MGEDAKKEQEDDAEPDEEEEEKEDREMADADPPTVELTAEEKKRWFRKNAIPGVAPYTLNTTFTKFTIPEKDEGLDEVRYEWHKDKQAKEYMKQWIRDRKCTTRIEDLQPSEWFTRKWKEWQKTLQQWHTKQNAYKDLVNKRTAAKAAKLAAKEAKKKEKE